MTHRPALLTAAVLFGAAALGVPAAAGAATVDADWTAPQPMRYGTPNSLPGNPNVVLNQDGVGVAVSDVGGSGRVAPHSDGDAFINGVFLDAKPFSTGTTAFGPASGAIAPYAHTGLMSAGIRARAASSQAVLAIGRLTLHGADVGTIHPAGPSNLHAYAPALAVNSEGDAAMVFPVCRTGSCTSSIVYLVTRRASSSRLTTTRVGEATGTLPRVAAAINERGDALAVWTDDTDVNARIRTLGGTLRSTQRVGPTQHGSLAAPSASLSLHRAELVGWSTQVVHEGDPTEGEVRVGQARDGGHFASTRVTTLPALSGQSVAGAAVRVAFDPKGVRHLAFTGYDGPQPGGHFVVASALVNGAANSGTVGLVSRQEVSAPGTDTILDDLDVGADGSELITMRSGIRGDEPIDGHAVVVAADRPTVNDGYRLTDLSAKDELATSAQAAMNANRAIVVWGTGTAGARYNQRFHYTG